MRLSVLEMNVGHGLYGASGAAKDLLDLIAQGDGRLLMAEFYARARRRTGSVLVDMAITPQLAALEAAALACRLDERISPDQSAGLIGFVLERIMHALPEGARP
ncbi:MAG: hypothetical protein HEQ16_05190 [Bosea sp.]|nr:hypothetical protein [Bosea sp. (in: a-proteobacteria)]